MVTAERRPVRLSRVPMSISALEAADLEQQGVRSTRDLAGRLPNVGVQPGISNGTGAIITIRGIATSADETFGFDNPVGLYLDGVPMPRAAAAAIDLVDVQSIEVLRGPQGTLFGRNTTGGAISLVPRAPDDAFGLSLRADVGSRGFRLLRGRLDSGRLGASPFYVYGAATAMFTAAAGQDLFTGETRSLARVEKLYAGLIFGEQGSGRAANISAGRQNFNLSDGFLFSQFSGSSNAGPRPGLFLNPRIAFDTAVLVDLKLDRLRVKAFYLDPDELEDFESRTQFAGLNATFHFNSATRLGVTYATIPQSDSRFRLPDGNSIARRGIETLAAEVRLNSPLGLKGLWAQGEYAHQQRGSEMRAWAGYATIGWRADSGWRPGLSYRYSAFSGDDSATARYERYDPMLSGGLGEWVQGINFKKLVGNTNMNVHRVRVTAKPNDSLNLTLDFFDFKARELNNLGATPALSTLASRDIGREVTLRGDWFLSRRLYLLLVASHAVPGDGIRLATQTGGRAWTTVQASLFWHL